MKLQRGWTSVLAAPLVMALASVGYAQQIGQQQGAQPRDEQAQRLQQLQQQQRQQAQPQQGEESDKVANYFAGELMLANKSATELAQVASQQASSDEVKQLAQTIANDHQQTIQRLAQVAPEAAAKIREQGQRLASQQQPGAAQQQPGAAQQQPGAAQQQPGAEQQAGAERQDPQRRIAGFRGVEQPGQSAQQDALDKICEVNMEACQTQLQMAKQMLNEQQGQDFDMAFLGQQIGLHTWLVAKLDALQGVGSSEFQQVVQQAADSAQQHLQQAKQLAKQLEDRERS